MPPYENRYWWSNDGLRLHYRDYPGSADRPPILCLPGLTRNARDYDDLARRLSPQWRVITVDLRGRGDSGYAKDPMSYVPLTYVQDIEGLLGELGVSRYIAFGTSLGGIVAMLLAGTARETLAGAAAQRCRSGDHGGGPVAHPWLCRQIEHLADLAARGARGGGGEWRRLPAFPAGGLARDGETAVPAQQRRADRARLRHEDR